MLSAEALTRTYTVDEFIELPEYEGRYELIEGELVEMPGPSYGHGLLTRRIFHYLDTYLTSNSIGMVLNNLAFELSPKNAPLPDVAFILQQRTVGVDYTKPFPGAPDLAVEVISRTDEVFKLDDKVKAYLNAGTRLIWVINPNHQLVFVDRLGQNKPLVLDINDDLDGFDVIPGFTLPVSKLFE